MSFPWSTNGGGMLSGPMDVCLTPMGTAKVPIPYANIAQCAQADGATCCSRIRIGGGANKAFNLGTEISASQGDEPAEKGIISGETLGPAKFIKGSMKVVAEGLPAVMLTSTTGQNGANANVPCGQQVAPSQMKVILGS